MPKNLHWPATSLSFLTQYSVHTNYTLKIQSSKQSELYQLLTYDLTTLDHLHVGTQPNIAHQHWMMDEFMISNCSLLFWKKLFKRKCKFLFMLQVSHCASEVTLKKKTKKAGILIRTKLTWQNNNHAIIYQWLMSFSWATFPAGCLRILLPWVFEFILFFSSRHA